MVKVFEGTDKQYSMDGYLHSNLKRAKEVIKEDWDMIFVYDGAEGTGKSVKAMQDAYYCDPSLDLDRVVFTPKDFRRAVINSKPYQAIVYDEAYTGLSSRATMSMINRTLVSMLAEIRQKNLFVFVVMPCFFDLDKYVALWRSRALIHVYANKFRRGFFRFYSYQRKKDMYIKGKKYYNYNCVKADFYGRFTKHYVVDEAKYRKKKRESLIEREKLQEQKEIKMEVEESMFLKLIEIGDEIKAVTKMKLLNMPPTTYYRKLKMYEERGELV